MKLNYGLNYKSDIEDIPNGTVFDSRNMTISDDGLSIQSDQGLTPIASLSNIELLGAISCNNEIVLFCKDKSIRRYNTITNALTTAVTNVTFYGGYFKGVYTYNANEELIIAFTEIVSDPNIIVPLRTINLNKPTDERLFDVNTKFPIINILNPSVTNSGSLLRKGSYNIFIRFKISNTDFTTWRNIGSTIFISDIKTDDITINYHKTKIGSGRESAVAAIVRREVNSNSDHADKQIEFDIDIEASYKTLYSGYEIACINNYNNAIDAKIVDDYEISNTRVVINGNYKSTVSVNDLTVDTAYVYNVKAIENYSNRLYIANYNEEFSNEDALLKPYVDKIAPIWRTDKLSNKMIIVSTFNTGNGNVTIPSTINTRANSLFINARRIKLVDYLSTVYGVSITPYQHIMLTACGSRVYKTDATGAVTTNTNTPVISDNHKIIEAQYIYVYPDVSDTNIPKFTYLSFVEKDSVNGKAIDYLEHIVGNQTGQQFGINLVPYDVKNITFVSDSVEASGEADHNDRMNKRTLDRGELYNFFVHYIADDGRITKGYKLTNYGVSNPTIYVDPLEALGVEVDIGGKVKDLSTSDILRLPSYQTLLNTIATPDNNTPTYHYVNNATKLANKDYGRFGYFRNVKGDVLFKSPDDRYLVTNRFDKTLYNIIPDFINIDKPSGYKAVMFSYEKVEPIVQFDAISCNKDYIHNEVLGFNSLRLHASEFTLFPSAISCNWLGFYSSSKQLLDVYSGSRNPIITESNRLTTMSVMSKESDKETYYRFDSTTIKDSSIDIKAGYEVAYKVDCDIQSVDTTYDTYAKCKVINVTDTKYLSNSKTLVSLGYVSAMTVSTGGSYLPSNRSSIQLELPNFHVVDSVYTFNRDGVIYNDTEPNPDAIAGDYKYWENPETDKVNEHGSPIRQVSYSKVSRIYIPAETFEKSHVTNLVHTFELAGQATGTIKKTTHAKYLKPEATADCFKLDTSYKVLPFKIYTAESDIKRTNYFPRTIRRSDVIQSESLENSWRYFRADNYKPITEDKGVITNLKGVGYYLLAHCEKSLFAFSKESTLQADNISVSLETPDTFDVAYQEVFPSDKGSCGLQHYYMNIVVDGSYYFYDGLSNRVYKWSKGNIDIISNNIDSIFTNTNNKYVVSNYRFTNDSPVEGSVGYDAANKRILFNFPTNSNEHIVFNYSLLRNNFVSYLTYPYTKYMISDYNNLYTISDINSRLVLYGVGDLKFAPFIQYGTESYIDIVFNGVDVDTVLRYITYNVDRLNYLEEDDNEIGTLSKLGVFTYNTATTMMDVKVDYRNYNLDWNYTKPYFDGEIFNMNYLFNAKATNDYTNPFLARFNKSVSYLSSNIKESNITGEPIHGKWFIVRMIFEASKQKFKISDVTLHIDKY